MYLHNACADVIVTKVAENSVARLKLPRLYRKTGALNSDFKPEVVIWLKSIRMHTEKLPK